MLMPAASSSEVSQSIVLIVSMNRSMAMQPMVKWELARPLLERVSLDFRQCCCRQTNEIDFGMKAILGKAQSLFGDAAVVAVVVAPCSPFPMDVCSYWSLPISHFDDWQPIYHNIPN
jgi:hypothetical protein